MPDFSRSRGARSYEGDVRERRGEVGSTHEGDMSTHPDVMEMRERYASRDREQKGSSLLAHLAVPTFLLGLYCAASPWITHHLPLFAMHNLLLGLGIAALAIAIAAHPRMSPLGWAIAGLGVWMIISPWVVARPIGPTGGIIANNVVIGALAILLGAACAFLGAKALKKARSHT